MTNDDLAMTTFSMLTAWNCATSPQEWAALNPADDSLLWREGLPGQIKDCIAIGHLAGLPVRVMGWHTSKSVKLPVSVFRAEIAQEETVYFVMRDNFYDLKLAVVSSCPITIPYEVIHHRVSEEWLADEKKRAHDYCSRNASFDASKYETDEWTESWGSWSVLRDDGEIYICERPSSCYYEGMQHSGVPEAAFQRYERGMSMFATPVHGAWGAMRVMESVVRDARRLVPERRRAKQEAVSEK